MLANQVIVIWVGTKRGKQLILFGGQWVLNLLQMRVGFSAFGIPEISLFLIKACQFASIAVSFIVISFGKIQIWN